MYQILVVEDDEVLRNGIVYALKKEGFQPLPAGSLRIEGRTGQRGRSYPSGCVPAGWRQQGLPEKAQADQQDSRDLPDSQEYGA